MQAQTRDDLTTKYTAILAGTEIAVGSVVHGLHIPFGGHVLSLNQGVILVLATKKSLSIVDASKNVNTISLLAAILKSLSPVGKKLTPMLALTCQGLLFSFGLSLGRNAVGVSFGFVLLAIWGFVQPILMYYFFFGKTLFEGIYRIWTESLSLSPEVGIGILTGIVLVKLVLAVGLAFSVWRAPSRWDKILLDRQKESHVDLPTKNRPAIDALKDLLNPIFLFSLLISFSFMYWNQSDSVSDIWLYILRPLALAYLFYWLARSLNASSLTGRAFLKRYPKLSSILDKLNNRSRI